MVNRGMRIMAACFVVAVLPVLLTACPVSSPASWYRYLGEDDGDDAAEAIIASPNGGYVIAGFTESSHEEDNEAQLIKIDGNGLRVWEYVMDGAADDVATCVVAALESGYVFGGEIGENEDTTISGFVTKVNSDGTKAWSVVLDSDGADRVVSIAATSDGGYAVLLSSDYLGAGEVVLVKLGAEGAELWRAVVATADNGVKVLALAEGASAVVTWRADLANSADGVITITQYTGSGAAGNSFSVTGDDALLVRDASRVSDGWILVGQKGLFSEDAHATVSRLDDSGAVVWSRNLGSAGRDEARAVAVSSDGSIFVTGTVVTENGKPDMYLAKLKADGSLLWERAFGEDDEDSALGLASATGGGVIMVGRSDSYEDDQDEENTDFLLVRTDAQGHCKGIEVELPVAETAETR